MPHPKLSNEAAQEAINLVAQHGGIKHAAIAIGMPEKTFENRYRNGLARGMTPTVHKIWESSGTTVLVIPDLHTPYHHPDAFEFLRIAKKKFCPSHIVCLGDEADQHAMSQYLPDPDLHSAGFELELAKEALRELAILFPIMKICNSNHMERYLKKAVRAGLPRKTVRRFAEIFESPIGWQWQDRWLLDGVIYEHGEECLGANGLRDRVLYNGKPTVIGHLHSKAGINYSNTGQQWLWGFNVGCLIDNDKYAFRYAKHFKDKPVLGLGIISAGVPQFYPMRLKEGRWDGRL